MFFFLLIIVTVAVIGAGVACGLSFVPLRAHDFFDTRWASVREVKGGGEGGKNQGWKDGSGDGGVIQGAHDGT